MKLQKTIRYSKFRKIRGNRALNKKYLSALAESIKDHNMLEQNPIMVNERMEVLDGQHRLNVAKLLDIPIYYLAVPTGSLREIQLLNTHQRRWTLYNFLDSWVERGKKDYIYIKGFCERTGVSLSIAIWLLSPELNRNETLDNFRAGSFIASRKQFAKAIVDRVKEMEKYTKDNAYTDRDFLRALVKVYRSGIRHEDLIEMLEKSKLKINRSANIRSYIREIEDVLNFRKQYPVRVRHK